MENRTVLSEASENGSRAILCSKTNNIIGLIMYEPSLKRHLYYQHNSIISYDELALLEIINHIVQMNTEFKGEIEG